MSTEKQDQTPANPTAQTDPSGKANELGQQASAKLHLLENQFVSLSSQRQLSFILGALFLLSAFTGGFGMLISFLFGVLMIFQGVSGKMLLNDFLDTMDKKHKKWLVPGFIGAMVLIMIASIVLGFTKSGTENNPRASYSQSR